MADNRASALQYLTRKGLTRAQAAGVVGSLMQESGLRTKAVNPSSGALGIGQWLGGRKTNLLNSGKSGGLQGQLDFLWSELQGPERAALTRLRGAHTVSDAASAFTWGFERPGRAEANMPNRIRQGRAALGLAGNNPQADPDEAEPPVQRFRTTTTSTPGVDNRQARAQLILNFLGNKKSDPLDFALQARGLRDVAPTSETTRTPLDDPIRGRSAGGAGAPGGDLAAVATQRASTIDKQRQPYSWGGGHAGQTPINKAVALDCSGAVSKVLGIDPRVADQFKTWGRAGDGGDKGVTIYSKPTHVLMKINGHFFGTSSTNPGGGAGWIEQGAISDSYLAGFTARHSDR
jgi:hypothetical protein